jgi:hypothetical protein
VPRAAVRPWDLDLVFRLAGQRSAFQQETG